MRPVVFGNTVGWLHAANGRRGVVIAGAHGFEDLCSRRFLTMMARGIAKEGLPVLQFDYPGCGDSAGDHEAPGRVAAWRTSIGAAIERLKRETGVDDVLVIGFRLGALLAPAAVAGRGDVSGLALLAPPASGKAYIRELTGLSRMIDGALLPHSETDTAVFHGIQAAGFRLTGETVAALGEMDWKRALARAPVDDVLVMPAVASPQLTCLAEDMRLNGRAADVAVFDGYQKLMCDPTANEIPQGVLEHCIAWAGARAAAEACAVAGDEPMSGSSGITGPHYREWPVVIGGGSEICGVLCLPAVCGDADDVVLFLNAGAVPHVGWARGTVEAARALAAEGRASLRIDLPGLGQSEPSPQRRLFLYDTRTRGDVMRVMDWLEGRGFPRVYAVGTCSGAFQAFHAARRDHRISGLAMINPLCFAWNSSYALDMGVWKVYENAKIRKKSAGDGEPVRVEPAGRLVALRGAVSYRGRRCIRRTLELMKSGLADLSPARLVSGRPVERWMSDLVARGTQVLMVTSEGDLSLQEIARHFGPNGERLARMPAVTMRQLPAADHTLTPLHARRMLAEHLAAFMHSGSSSASVTSKAGRPNGALKLVSGEL